MSLSSAISTVLFGFALLLPNLARGNLGRDGSGWNGSVCWVRCVGFVSGCGNGWISMCVETVVGALLVDIADRRRPFGIQRAAAVHLVELQEELKSLAGFANEPVFLERLRASSGLCRGGRIGERGRSSVFNLAV